MSDRGGGRIPWGGRVSFDQLSRNTWEREKYCSQTRWGFSLQECGGVCGWEELHSAAKYGCHKEIPEDHPW